MYLLVGLFIGSLYGRNAHSVNQQTYEDIQKIWQAFRKTKFAFNLYYLSDGIYNKIAEHYSQKVVYTHDILCTCNRRSCKPLSVNSYVRKLKAAN